MRNFFTQGHSQILRDLILNEGLDRPDATIIDFTYGTGSMWKSGWPYKFKLVKCDAVPTNPDVIIKKDLLYDDYTEFAPCNAGIFDPPYLIGRQKQDHRHKAFDHNNKLDPKQGTLSVVPASRQGPNSWAHNEQIDRFTGNKNEDEFVERVRALNKAAAQCIKPKPDGLLFVKIMDTRHKDSLFPAHFICWRELTNFQLFANCAYLAIGSHTWKSKYEGSFGYWMVFSRRKK